MTYEKGRIIALETGLEIARNTIELMRLEYVHQLSEKNAEIKQLKRRIERER